MFKKGEHIVSKTVGEENCILLDLESGDYFSLNSTARYIWGCLEHGLTKAEIADKISMDFGIDVARAEQDIQKMLGILLDNNLVIKVAENSHEPKEVHT